MSTLIQCDTADDMVSILKMLIVDADCEPYTDCDNASESLESLLKQSLYLDDGVLTLNLCTDG